MTTTTDNLAIVEVAENQTDKELTMNTALNALDNAQNRTLPVTFVSNAYSLSAAEFTRNFRFRNSATFSAAATLTVPLSNREFAVSNTDSTYPIHVKGSSGATVTVDPGWNILIFNDGTDCVALTSDATPGDVTSVLGNIGAVLLSDLVTGGVAPLASPDFTGTVTAAAMAAGAGLFDLSGATEVKVPTPSAGADAATKAYVDGLVQGLQVKPSAHWATAAALAANTYANGSSGVGATLTANADGALSVDGGSPGAGDVVLVKDEVAGADNGVYIVTAAGDGSHPYVLTRHVSMDQTGDFVGGFVVVEAGGSANANSMWVCTNTSAPTVGTTAITFTQLANPTSYTAGNLISLSGNTIAVGAVASMNVIANTDSVSGLPVATPLGSMFAFSGGSLVVTGLAPSGSAGGDLSGTFPNPAVAKINGQPLASTTPTSAHLLIANGSSWASQGVSGDVAISNAGSVTFQKTTGAGRLTGNPGTAAAVYQDVTVSSGLSLSSAGSLVANWQGSVVSALGLGFSAGSGTLNAISVVTSNPSAGGTVTISGTAAQNFTLINMPATGGTVTLAASPTAWLPVSVHIKQGTTPGSIALGPGFVFPTSGGPTSITLTGTAGDIDRFGGISIDGTHYEVDALAQGYTS